MARRSHICMKNVKVKTLKKKCTIAMLHVIAHKQFGQYTMISKRKELYRVLISVY